MMSSLVSQLKAIPSSSKTQDDIEVSLYSKNSGPENEATPGHFSMLSQIMAKPHRWMSETLVTCLIFQKLEDNLHILQISIKVFAMLVNLVQSFNKKAVLLCVLKVSQRKGQSSDILCCHHFRWGGCILRPSSSLGCQF